MKQQRKQKLIDLAQGTAKHVEQFGSTLQDLLDQAPEKIDQIRETVSPTLDRLQETLKTAENRAGETSEQAARLAHVTQRKGQALQKAFSEQRDHDSAKCLWFFIGLGAGALLGLFLAPSSGRRSRALVRDQLHKNRKNLARATSNHAADLSHKAKGLSHKIQSTIKPSDEDEPTDEILADRVRTTLGQNPETSLPHLNIECSNGVVTLYGPTVDSIQEATLINAIQGIRGVIDVRSKLPISGQ